MNTYAITASFGVGIPVLSRFVEAHTIVHAVKDFLDDLSESEQTKLHYFDVKLCSCGALENYHAPGTRRAFELK